MTKLQSSKWVFNTYSRLKCQGQRFLRTKQKQDQKDLRKRNLKNTKRNDNVTRPKVHKNMIIKDHMMSGKAQGIKANFKSYLIMKAKQ